MGSTTIGCLANGIGSKVLLAADGGDQVDFFIHGYKKFTVFGQELYLTTTHNSMSVTYTHLTLPTKLRV